ncbi:MAG TPA: hypothetical protein PK402_03820 [Tepidisphaeraceae bacterium]|nr:hypothetical protein [Tepidisphaeraceae bacterium]
MDDPELTKAVAEFTWAFEQVFHHDWQYARSMLHPMNGMISDEGTFIEPRVEDEEEDWGFRAILLEKYRTLRALLDARGITPARDFGDATAA